MKVPPHCYYFVLFSLVRAQCHDVLAYESDIRCPVRRQQTLYRLLVSQHAWARLPTINTLEPQSLVAQLDTGEEGGECVGSAGRWAPEWGGWMLSLTRQRRNIQSSMHTKQGVRPIRCKNPTSPDNLAAANSSAVVFLDVARERERERGKKLIITSRLIACFGHLLSTRRF